MVFIVFMVIMVVISVGLNKKAGQQKEFLIYTQQLQNEYNDNNDNPTTTTTF